MADKKKAKAQGGPINPSDNYVVGEKGPEKFTQPTGTADLEGKNIDQRMADLLKDHQKMGAR